MSSPDIAGILDNSRELDRLRKDQEEIIMEINKIHKKLQSNNEQKKKRVKVDSSDALRQTSMRSHLESLANLKGEKVVARVSRDDAGKYEWFVIKVIHFDKETQQFEVLDEEPSDDEESSGQSYILEFDDDEEDGSLPQQSVPFHRVVPLPDH